MKSNKHVKTFWKAASKITEIGSTPFPMHMVRPDGAFATNEKDVLHSILPHYTDFTLPI
jgi:hypothetical protein